MHVIGGFDRFEGFATGNMVDIYLCARLPGLAASAEVAGNMCRSVSESCELALDAPSKRFQSDAEVLDVRGGLCQ
jgi:hypothetical protein